MIDDGRVRELNHDDIDAHGEYVLYWMQASQRTRHNPALEYAVDRANGLAKPVVVCFGLMDDYPGANERHYQFLIEGLKDVHDGLAERGIRFLVKHGPPFAAAIHYGKRACLVVCDRGYTNHQKAWRDKVADGAGRLVVQVEGDVVVPVEVVSDKHEFAARTIRPKIHKHCERFLRPIEAVKPSHSSTKLKVAGDIDVTDVAGTMKRLKLDRSVSPVSRFVGGERAAGEVLTRFLTDDLRGYADKRNEPAEQHSSTMSPYLHYGHISPVEIALAVKARPAGVDADSYLEELIVRRELSMNFCHFEPKYDQYDGLPAWARKTLAEHRNDPREYVYTERQLESADTHDPYWNAAQTEMSRTGFMHNYMRMYWGKKILEWSATPEQGFDTTLRINNKYFLCGRDPNSFANVAWVYGTHDRPWGPARPIFGTVRYMNAAGLKRKFDIDRYVARVAGMT